jgi:uncharacterized membrane protein YfcA
VTDALPYSLMLVGFGISVGAAAGVLGVGGGIMMVPFLVFAAGMSQHEAEATSLVVILPTAIVASVSLRRRGIGDLPLAIKFGAVGSVASLAGALLALSLSSTVLQRTFAAFLAVVGLRLVRDAYRLQ